MKYHIKFEIDIASLEEVISKEISLEHFLNEILDNTFDEVEISNRELLAAKVLEHYQDIGGAPEILDFEIVEASLNLEKLVGEVYLSYEIYKNFGCDDFNKRDKYDGDKWDFEINVNESTITFSSYDYPDREPDLF